MTKVKAFGKLPSFTSMEVRVGLADSSSATPGSLLEVNQECDWDKEAASETEVGAVEFNCAAPLLGRYVTIQRKVAGQAEVADIEVYGFLGRGQSEGHFSAFGYLFFTHCKLQGSAVSTKMVWFLSFFSKTFLLSKCAQQLSRHLL